MARKTNAIAANAIATNNQAQAANLVALVEGSLKSWAETARAWADASYDVQVLAFQNLKERHPAEWNSIRSAMAEALKSVGKYLRTEPLKGEDRKKNGTHRYWVSDVPAVPDGRTTRTTRTATPTATPTATLTADLIIAWVDACVDARELKRINNVLALRLRKLAPPTATPTATPKITRTRTRKTA